MRIEILVELTGSAVYCIRYLENLFLLQFPFLTSYCFMFAKHNKSKYKLIMDGNLLILLYI